MANESNYKYFSQLVPHDKIYVAHIGQNNFIGKVTCVKIISIKKVERVLGAEYHVICSDGWVFDIPVKGSSKYAIQPTRDKSKLIYANKSDIISQIEAERKYYEVFYDEMLSTVENG